MSDAADLASLFFQWSKALDDYRDAHFDTLTSDQKLRLKDLSNQLDDISTHFNLEDAAATLASIQDKIDQIKTVTAQAKKTLSKLNTVEQVTKVVTAVVALGVSAASGNPGAIVGAIGDFTKAIAPAEAGARSGE